MFRSIHTRWHASLQKATDIGQPSGSNLPGPTMPCFDPSRVLTQPVACYATLMGELPCLALPWAACGNQWHCMQNLLLSFFCHELFWHPLLEATTWNLARYARMTLLQQKHLWQLLLQNCSSLHKPFPQHLPRPSTSVLFAVSPMEKLNPLAAFILPKPGNLGLTPLTRSAKSSRVFLKHTYNVDETRQFAAEMGSY